MNTTKTTTLPKEGPVTAEFAKSVLSEVQFQTGGGWTKIGRYDVYMCCGAHKDGTAGWKIVQVGRTF